MPVDRRGHINSERFRISVPNLYVLLSSRACNHREMNHAEDRSEKGKDRSQRKRKK